MKDACRARRNTRRASRSFYSHSSDGAFAGRQVPGRRAEFDAAEEPPRDESKLRRHQASGAEGTRGVLTPSEGRSKRNAMSVIRSGARPRDADSGCDRNASATSDFRAHGWREKHVPPTDTQSRVAPHGPLPILQIRDI